MQSRLQRAGFQEHQLDAEGISINYAEGPDAGPPLLLIPGQTMPWQSYSRVLPALAHQFRVFAVDIRGHGRSSRTPGRYTWDTVGGDLARLLGERVGRPAMVSGNSSGGVLAVWLAANHPELVSSIVPEDPPLFSAQWPRLRECYVYRVIRDAVACLDRTEGKDVPGFFARLKIPIEGDTKIAAVAGPLLRLVAAYVRLMQWLRPGAPYVHLPLAPFPLKMMVRGFSSYDPAFSRGFLDGAFDGSFDHADALRRVSCPMLLIHANWFVSKQHGLVGAMTDQDAARVQELAPHCNYLSLPSGHVVHQEQPKVFIRELLRFASPSP